MPKHDQKPSLRRRHIALATLTATLTMGLSHQAMAACVASSTTGTVVDCSDTSELPTTTFPTVSISDFGSTVTNQVGVRLTTNGTKFENETTIESKITDVAGPPNRYFFNVYGVATTDIDDSNWTIDNKGKIHGESAGLGNLAGVAVIGDAGEARVTNTGEISIKRGFDDMQVTVLELSDQRLAAPFARLLYAETEASKARRAREAEARAAADEISSDRPSKLQRRLIHRFKRSLR